MSLLTLLAALAAGVLFLIGVATPVVLGPSGMRRLRRIPRERLADLGPSLGLLAAVLVLNKFLRDVAPEVSRIVGIHVTGTIHAIEGGVVVAIQSVATPWLTTYFSLVYLFGYVFLLTFPFVVYLTLDESTPLKRTAVAYALNYAIGLVCYVLFISYGPRNLIPDLVHPLLYSTYPRSQLIVSEVNANTNVFPSLHTSLSVTVALQAWRTRAQYPVWTGIAAFLGGCVVLSTMYLGIHWATDVVAGAVLGVTSVTLARRLTT